MNLAMAYSYAQHTFTYSTLAHMYQVNSNLSDNDGTHVVTVVVREPASAKAIRVLINAMHGTAIGPPVPDHIFQEKLVRADQNYQKILV